MHCFDGLHSYCFFSSFTISMSAPVYTVSLKLVVSKWLYSLAPTRKMLLKDALHAFLGLQQIKIDFSFIHVALNFWDPDRHMFAFRNS